jgi:ribosomal protein S18 acetylase RimI-like enzyme
MKIIEAANEHLDELRAVGIQTYKQHFSGIWSEDGLNSYLESHFNIPKLQTDLDGDVIKYFLTFVEENPVGFIKLKKNQPVPNRGDEYGLELEKIYLLENFAGLGLGKMMIEFVIDYAENLREKSVWLDVLKINTGAIRFYKNQGFQIIDEFEFSTDITKPDMLVMKYEI